MVGVAAECAWSVSFSKVGGRKINVRVLDYLGLEAGGVTRPNLPLTCGRLDCDPTRINLSVRDHLATKWTWTVEGDFRHSGFTI